MKTKKKRADWIPTQLLRFFLWQATFMTEIQDSVIGPLTGIPTGTGSKLAALLSLQSAYVAAYNLAPPHTRPGTALIKRVTRQPSCLKAAYAKLRRNTYVIMMHLAIIKRS
jgi:hypothetical protein